MTTPEQRVGTTLAGKYELVRLLGVGGSGAVYEARHERTGARYAIKLLLPSADRGDGDRMLREARALAKLDHPHIVRLVDLDDDGQGELYLVEELLHGRTLRALLDEELILPAQRALEVIVPILRALAYAHARGIVHRDLKPENIFLCEDDAGRVTPKLLDFGLVREAATSSGATRPGTLLGTPRYMSPEQAWGRDDIGPRSDLWSLAIVLYECLSGVSPFEGTNDRAVLASIVATDAPHLRTTGVAVDDDLADAVMLALTRAPEARIPSATAWEAALAAVPSLASTTWHAALFANATAPAHEPAHEPTLRATAATGPDAPRRPRALALSALALVALAILSWVLFQGAPAAEPADASTTAHLDSRPVEPAGSGHTPTAAEASTAVEDRPTTATLPPSARIAASEPADDGAPGSPPEPARATGTLTPPQATGQRAGTGSTDRRPSEPPRRAEDVDSTPRAADTQPTTGANAAPLVDEL